MPLLHLTQRMARQSQAFRALAANLGRARALLEIHDTGSLRPQPGDRRPRGRPSPQERELPAAAVIVALDGLDAFLADVEAEAMVAQLASELLFVRDPQQRRDVTRDAIRAHLGPRIQAVGAEAVSGTFARMGRNLDWAQLDAHLPSALSGRLLRRRRSTAELLDHWTRVRHALVHQGSGPRIKSGQAWGVVALVELVAAAVEDALPALPEAGAPARDAQSRPGRLAA